jgi:hypothetical protein
MWCTFNPKNASTRYLHTYIDIDAHLGCQIFLFTSYQNGKQYNTPNEHKIDQMDGKIDQININVHNIPTSMQDLPKFTQNGKIGLKICHLATMITSSELTRESFAALF